MCTNRYLEEADSYLAIKTIDTKSLTATQIKSIIYEINILSQLQNQSGIVKLHSVFNHRSVIYMVSTVSIFILLRCLCGKPSFSYYLSHSLSLSPSLSHSLSYHLSLILYFSFSLCVCACMTNRPVGLIK